jgi:hypothetical protein
MAIFRKIHTSFWSDTFVSELTEKEKLFYLYILTNERTTQLGVYEISKKQICFDLSYSIDLVSMLIKKFEKWNKIKYNNTTNEISVKNWDKYNLNPSSKVQVLVNKEIAKVKDKALIQYKYSSDTVSIHNPQEEEEEEEETKEKEIGGSIEPALPPLTLELEATTLPAPPREESEHKLIIHIKSNYPTVARLAQMTNKQAEELVATYKRESISKKLGAMENKKSLLKDYKSCFLTLKNWLDMDDNSRLVKQITTGETESEKRAREIKEREDSWKKRNI